MGSGRVKIPEQDIFCLCRFGKFINDLLTHLFGISVGRFSRLRCCLFGYRNFIGFTVNRTGRRENKMGDIEFLYTFEQVDQGDQVVFKIQQGLCHRFAHCFIGRKMDYTCDIGILLENRERVVEIAEIHFIVLYFFTGDFFHAQQDIGIGTGVVIYRNNLVSVFHQVHNGM